MSDDHRQTGSDRCGAVLAEYLLRIDRGEIVDQEEFLAAHPDVADELRAHFANGQAVDSENGTGTGHPCPGASPIFGAASGIATLDVPPEARPQLPLGPSPGPLPKTASAAQLPTRIGRYRVDRLLGQGGFGAVYLARDDQLQRHVAIKVPHREVTSQLTKAEAYLAEARMLAHLDHPHIVPVHDVGSTAEFPCFIVSKYIEGMNLAERMLQSRLPHAEAAELTAIVAEALHYAHKQGLVHRDIKPGNILIDRHGKPYVADFGLALREAELGTGPRRAGTPAYMSPEQARREGHRVDGRSDIYSLGVVLYELLTGRRTFTADSQEELLELIATQEPKPPRQIADGIPKELERICLKALSRRARDRYTTAQDLAEDLRHFTAQQAASPATTPALADTAPQPGPDAKTPRGDSATPASDSRPIRIVPKGLRSFDEHDADFFLELLPGPRDRDGLPDSLRFWKSRIEETDADKTFSVGLIYGPSGCGKSSLMKAGLLPRLSHAVISVYVESTAQETESRLLNGLRKRCRNLPRDLDLKQTLTALRRGQSIASGKKVVIVLDQFEQWLHGRTGEEDGALIQALRQCDGSQVQCLVMVRDDFWMAATRFMRELEIRLLEGHNSAAVDLFPVRHAERVLAAFGRAFGSLPEKLSETTADQQQFLQQAVAGLSEEGKVISVRLALFAEMLKGRPWEPSALKQVGGTEGVGVAFLEETFSACTSPPEHRYHQKAAREVLKALLPESGTNIRGHMRSYEELLQTSRYASRPQDFEALLNILDSELRLITPTDPEGLDGGEETGATVSTGQERTPSPRYSGESVGVRGGAADAEVVSRPLPTRQRHYQLTHDYLVPSLREWLTRKQRETRRGRAELRLAERAALWNAKPENRHLPSWWEYLSIASLTARKNWTEPHRKMMRRAGRVLGVRWGSALLVALLIGITVQQSVSSVRHRILSERTQTAVAAMSNSRGVIVPRALQDLEGLPSDMVLAELLVRFGDSAEGRRRPLAYALAHFGDVRVDFLVSQIKDASADEVDNFVTAFGGARQPAIAALKATAVAIEGYGRETTPSPLHSGASVGVKGEAATAEDVSRRVQDWRWKARVAIVALHLGDDSVARDMFELRPDPIQRTLLIDTFPNWHGDVARLALVAADSTDATFRSGACLGIGSIPAEEVTAEAKQAWQSLLSEWYKAQPDPGTHGAAGWALRKWQLPLPKIASSVESVNGHEWYVNSLGMTMLRIPAGKFSRRDTDSENAAVQEVRLTRPFFLCDREVPVGLFQQFMDDTGYGDEKPKDWTGPAKGISRTPDHPVQQVSWDDAVLFCNWLSRKERLTPCYERSGKKRKEVRAIDGKRVDVEIDVREWERVGEANGYRLPTEAEWEYACRSESVTGFGHGDDESLLSKYAVFVTSRTEPCGSKLPNGWGLFDIHGNVMEWCADWYGGYAGASAIDDPRGPQGGSSRVYRGGSWDGWAVFCRSANRYGGSPSYRDDFLGFRVARSSSGK